MNRRAFLHLAAAGALATRHRRAEARAQEKIPYGATPLGLSDERDGTLYVPKSYKPGVPRPVLMMLHGFGGAGGGIGYLYPLAEEFGIILIGPESRDITWGKEVPGFDADVKYLGAAYRFVRDQFDIDRTHVALGGQSDGAGYALSMGLAYGDTFNHLIILAAGGWTHSLRALGKPRIFVAHGVKDTTMPIAESAWVYVPELRKEGYDVTFREHEGGHRAPAPVVREAIEWFVGPGK
jgi:predicted esterase